MTSKPTDEEIHEKIEAVWKEMNLSDSYLDQLSSYTTLIVLVIAKISPSKKCAMDLLKSVTTSLSSKEAKEILLNELNKTKKQETE